MLEITTAAAPAKSSPKGFPRYCDRCRDKSVWPATVSYRSNVRHDGDLHCVDLPQLTVPRCQKCGELYFDNAAEEQVSRALRGQLQLLQPEQIRLNRLALNLSAREMAECLGTSAAQLTAWEEGLEFQSRAIDNLLRAFFALTEVRAALRGPEQNPAFGAVVTSV